jgi:purine-binding chemotaxis protein CheW
VSHDVDRVVVFKSGLIRFGLDVDLVQEVIAACEVSPLPDAPAPVSGVVTIDGEVVAVVDPHRHFKRDGVATLGIETRFLLVKSPVGTIAIVADAVEGVIDVLHSALKAAEQLVGGMSLLKNVAAAVGGLVYIFDPKALLTATDEAALRAALGRLQP